MKFIFRTAVILFFVLTIVAAFFIWSGQQVVIKKNIPDCRAAFVIHNYDYRVPLVLNIRVSENKGLVFFEGPVYQGNRMIGTLNRQVEFDVTRFSRVAKNRGTVLYTGVNMTRFPKDTLPQTDAERILPKFFVIEKSSSYFDIINMKSGAIFIKDNIPIFFCRHNAD